MRRITFWCEQKPLEAHRNTGVIEDLLESERELPWESKMPESLVLKVGEAHTFLNFTSSGLSRFSLWKSKKYLLEEGEGKSNILEYAQRVVFFMTQTCSLGKLIYMSLEEGQFMSAALSGFPVSHNVRKSKRAWKFLLEIKSQGCWPTKNERFNHAVLPLPNILPPHQQGFSGITADHNWESAELTPSQIGKKPHANGLCTSVHITCYNMSINKKNTKDIKRQETQPEETKQASEPASDMTEMFNLLYRKFKTTMINILRALVEKVNNT